MTALPSGMPFTHQGPFADEVGEGGSSPEVTVASVPPLTSKHEPTSSPARVLSLRWWALDKNGRWALGQRPNLALSVWLVTVIVGWSVALGPAHRATLTTVGQGALVVWALDELAQGVSPARRVLGAVVVVVELVRLFA